MALFIAEVFSSWTSLLCFSSIEKLGKWWDCQFGIYIWGGGDSGGGGSALSRVLKGCRVKEGEDPHRIKEGWKHDPMAKKIIALVKDGKTQRFWLKGDMLFTKGDRLYVPTWGDLRRVILKECHDSKWVGHLGIKRTLPLVEGTYYWPRKEDDVKTFVRTCLISQQDKIEKKKSRGLLEPLPTHKGPWESVSMDFITCLLKSERSGSIIVVVYRFSKYETFIAAPPDVTADDTSKLFFKNMVKYYGLPHVIVSDRDPQFTRRDDIK
ncbi:putative nucleotidyltransferase, ribonuclease H [Tanacetum coccineum]